MSGLLSSFGTIRLFLLHMRPYPPPTLHPPRGSLPVLLSVPHAGREYDEAILANAAQGIRSLETLEDPLVDRLCWRAISAGFGAVIQNVPRAVIDCNRDPARPDAMPEASDGSAIPGNVGLTAADRALREAEGFAPYHRRIAGALDARGGRPTIVVALHSFTPVMAGFRRPWTFGVLHLGASPFCEAMLAALRAEPDAPVVGGRAKKNPAAAPAPAATGRAGVDWAAAGRKAWETRKRNEAERAAAAK